MAERFYKISSSSQNLHCARFEVTTENFQSKKNTYQFCWQVQINCEKISTISTL